MELSLTFLIAYLKPLLETGFDGVKSGSRADLGPNPSETLLKIATLKLELAEHPRVHHEHVKDPTG